MLCHTKWVSCALSNFNRTKYIFKQRNISTSQKGRIRQKLRVARLIWVFIALGMYDFDYTIPCHPLFFEILPTTSIKNLLNSLPKSCTTSFNQSEWQSRDKSANFCPNACLTNQLCINRFSQKNLSNDSTYRVS